MSIGRQHIGDNTVADTSRTPSSHSSGRYRGAVLADELTACLECCRAASSYYWQCAAGGQSTIQQPAVTYCLLSNKHTTRRCHCHHTTPTSCPTMSRPTLHTHATTTTSPLPPSLSAAPLTHSAAPSLSYSWPARSRSHRACSIDCREQDSPKTDTREGERENSESGRCDECTTQQ